MKLIVQVSVEVDERTGLQAFAEQFLETLAAHDVHKFSVARAVHVPGVRGLRRSVVAWSGSSGQWRRQEATA